MNKPILRESDENTCQITLEFLEDGYVLKTGNGASHRYELDVVVRNDITLEQLLAAVYSGIRDVLTDRYGLDPTGDIGGISYEQQDTPFEERTGRQRDENYHLRPKVGRELLLRASAMRYNARRRKIADMEQRYPTRFPQAPFNATPEERERMGWIVCWQVFHECYSAYAVGYPESRADRAGRRGREEVFQPHPILMRSSVDLKSTCARDVAGEPYPPLLWLEKEQHGSRTLGELGFLTATRLVFDPVLWSQYTARYDERQIRRSHQDPEPRYNITRRPVIHTDTRQIRIDPPPDRPEQPRPDLIPVMLTPLILIGAVIAILAVSSIPLSTFVGVMLILTMVISTVVVYTVLNRLAQRGYREQMDVWRSTYEIYIRQTITEILVRQENDSAQLHRCYPPVYDRFTENDLLRGAITINGAIFTRQKSDPDFLSARIGTSMPGSCLVSSLFPVSGEIQETAFSAVRYENVTREKYSDFRLLLPGEVETQEEKTVGYLERLPGDIAREYNWLANAPVLLQLGRYRSSGIVVQDRSVGFMPLLTNLLLDLCFHHDPEQLQIVMLCSQERDWRACQDRIQRFRHLPHMRKLMQDRSAFAFSKEEAWHIFDRLLARQNSADAANGPHVLVILEEEYDLQNHPLSALLPQSASELTDVRGTSFLFCKERIDDLPLHCGETVVCDDRSNWHLYPHIRQQGRRERLRGGTFRKQYAFKPDPIPKPHRPNRESRARDIYQRAFATLSAMHYRNSGRFEVPAYCDLFHLLSQGAMVPDRDLEFDPAEPNQSIRRIHQTLEDFVASRWNRPQGRPDWSGFEIPLARTCGSVVRVDLHPDGDGAHMLVSGDPGSGKTNCLLTCLLMLCAHYTPQEVSVLLVSIQNSVMASTMTPVPHVKQIITDKDYTISSVGQRIRELCNAVDQELLERQLAFSRMGTGNISGYNRAVRDLDRHVAQTLRPDAETDAERIRELKQMSAMPDLFVVLDDVDKLLMYAGHAAVRIDLADWLMRTIQRAAGAGVHILLSATRIDQVLPAELLRLLPVRVCLKCADSTAMDFLNMGNTQYAGNMPGNGRAWLFSTGRTYSDYAQVGYSARDLGAARFAPYRITLASAGREYVSFFDSEDVLGREAHGTAPASAGERPARTAQTDRSRPAQGDRRYGEAAQAQAAQTVDLPDTILNRGGKTGMTQGELLASAIRRYEANRHAAQPQGDARQN